MREPPARMGSPTVLIIEDDEEVRALLRELLTLEGYRVEIAPSGVDGVRLARRLRPQLITLDLGLPGKSGFQVLRELRTNRATWGIPVLVLSAYTDVLQSLWQVPPEHRFSKPLEIRRFLESVAAALRPSGGR